MMFVYSVLDTWCGETVSHLYASEESAIKFKQEYEKTLEYDPRFYNEQEIAERFDIEIQEVRE